MGRGRGRDFQLIAKTTKKVINRKTSNGLRRQNKTKTRDVGSNPPTDTDRITKLEKQVHILSTLLGQVIEATGVLIETIETFEVAEETDGD